MSKKYDKLVRDKIPEIIKESGGTPQTEILDDKLYLRMLNYKLCEELNEYLKDLETEELADLVEVVYAILDFKGMSLEEFEKIRQTKLLERGGFKDRVLLKAVIKD